jgi:hypothetical protein
MLMAKSRIAPKKVYTREFILEKLRLLSSGKRRVQQEEILKELNGGREEGGARPAGAYSGY